MSHDGLTSFGRPGGSIGRSAAAALRGGDDSDNDAPARPAAYEVDENGLPSPLWPRSAVPRAPPPLGFSSPGKRRREFGVLPQNSQSSEHAVPASPAAPASPSGALAAGGESDEQPSSKQLNAEPFAAAEEFDALAEKETNLLAVCRGDARPTDLHRSAEHGLVESANFAAGAGPGALFVICRDGVVVTVRANVALLCRDAAVSDGDRLELRGGAPLVIEAPTLGFAVTARVVSSDHRLLFAKRYYNLIATLAALM